MKKTGFTHESTRNESKEWYTPRYIFKALRIQFELDVASPGAEIVPWIPAKRHLTEYGLMLAWEGTVWCNPPYGQDTPDWMNRLIQHGAGIALVFSRTDTKWFQESLVVASAICFIKGRVCFVPSRLAKEYATGRILDKDLRSGSGSGSALIAFGEKAAKAVLECELGLCMKPVRKESCKG